MSKLDKTKETLNNLRVAITLIVALIIATVSGSLSALKQNELDYFYLGVVMTVILSLSGYFVLHLLIKKTREIEDL